MGKMLSGKDAGLDDLSADLRVGALLTVEFPNQGVAEKVRGNWQQSTAIPF